MAEAATRWHWKFEPTVNLGHVFTVIALMAGGVSVYVGVFQTLTQLVLKVNDLETKTATADAVRQQTFENKAAITQLSDAVTAIKASNDKLLEQLTGIRIDVGILSQTAQSGNKTDKP